jgi:circadian clock protein KaiB
MAATAAIVSEELTERGKGPLVLRLYVAGDAPNSARARANLRRLHKYRLEIIDCLDEPLRVLDDGVLVTPTLVRVQPLPQRTVVGTLSAIDRVADALEIEAITLPQGDGASHE